MAAPKLNEKSSVALSPELKLTLDLIQDATLVHPDEEILSFSQLNIASPHMPPHQYLVDSEDEIDESDDDDDDDDDYNIINNFIIDDDDSDDDDNDFNNDKSKFIRPPSRLGRPIPYSKSRNPKRNGLSVDRIKMENAFLKNQNNKLAQELDQCRLTIQALKSIVGQKDVSLQNSRAEYQQAIIQIRVLEALILSKHSKDGSIIVRSSAGVGYNNLPSVNSILLQQEKESIMSKDIPKKPVSQVSATAPQSPQQQSPILPSVTDSSDPSDYSDYSDENDFSNLSSNLSNLSSPPPLPPKRMNRHNRRWSMEFGSNNHLGNDFEEYNMTDMSNMTSDNLTTDMLNITSNITHITSSDDNTLISGTPSSSTLITPVNNHDLHRNLPRILKRRTGDIIQSLASCRPSSTKNGYDHSPPSTPSSERDSDDSNESVINEKCEKPIPKRKNQNMSRFRKIFLR